MTLFNPHLSPAERYRRTALTMVAGLFGLLCPLAAGMHALSRAAYLSGEISTYETSLFTSMALFSCMMAAAVMFEKEYISRFEEPALSLPPPSPLLQQHGFTVLMLSIGTGIIIVTLLSFSGLPEAWRPALASGAVAVSAGTVAAIWLAPWAFVDIPVPVQAGGNRRR